MDESTELPAQPTSTATTSGGRWKKHSVELATITVGVLIALSLEGIRQRVSDRALVREAERTLVVEIEENRAEIESVIAGDEQRQAALEQALRFADELLENGATEVDELELGFSLAEVSSASWMTAERTGAIAHMDYERVRAMSRVYEAQDLFIMQQRQNLARLATAMAMLSTGDDPTQAAADDLRRFREEVLGLRAELYIQRQLAERVRALYVEALSVAGRPAEASPIP
jgi:hypothetical protein